MGPSLSLDLKVDDVIAYNLHVLRASTASKKQMRRVQLLASPMVLLVLVLGLLGVALRIFGAIFILVCGLALLVWIVLLPRYAAWAAPQRIRRVFANGLIAAPTPSRVWVDENGGIVEQRPDRTTWYAPFAITGIEETPDYVFVLAGPGDPLILPRRLGASAVETFVQALNWHRAPRGII